MNRPRRRAARGFTLIEVLIALLVVALGIGALLTTISSSADTVGRLRDKSFAQWIALNQIALLRLSGEAPAVGISTGDMDFGGTHWKYQQEVTDPGIAGILRVDVRVARQVAGKSTTTVMGDDAFPAIGTGYGFVGSAVMRSSGIDPDWSLAGAVQRGTGGTGGGGPTGPTAPQGTQQ